MGNDNSWLNEAIAQGLMGLVALRLPNTPPEEVIVKTAKIWVLALTKGCGGQWVEDEDRWRIEKAFVRLYADCEFFPSPKMLIERLPKRKQPEVFMLERKVTDEERLRTQQMCKKMMAILKGVKINA